MRKVISMLVVLLLCASFAGPVFAADDFVPSISEKAEPDVVAPSDNTDVIGLIRDENGEVMDEVETTGLVITPVSSANTSDEISDDSKAVLLSVYSDLSDGTMALPYEELGLDPTDMVVRDLIDISWLDEEHRASVEVEGVVLELTFDLGVSADTDVYVMTYKNDKWNPVDSVVNNGDGTVTCLFDHLCPIVFCVEASTITPPAQTGDTFDVMLWSALLTVSTVALVALVVVRSKFAR